MKRKTPTTKRERYEPVHLGAQDASKAIAKAVRKDDVLQNLIGVLARVFPIDRQMFLVGGILRDFFISPEITPKDIDIVLQGITSEQLGSLPEAEMNFFGGASFRFQGATVDIWPLAETYHIKEFGLECTIQGFLVGAPFNLDKVAFDLQTNVLYDRGCLDGIQARTISYTPIVPYLEHIQAVRCVVLQQKTRFHLADSAQALMRRGSRALLANHALWKESLSYLQAIHDESFSKAALDRVLELSDAS